MLNLSNGAAETAIVTIGTQANGTLGIAYAGDVLNTTIFNGTGGAVSKELKAITGSNLLTANESLNVLSRLLTSEGKRGGPEGIDNVALTSITEDSATVTFTRFFKGEPVIDTITFDFEDGLLDAELGGGQNAGDAKSSYAVIESGEGIIGTAFLGKISGGEYHVGGSLRGEEDTKTILDAALDGDFEAVQLVGLASDSFSVTISRGQATDTYTFTGENAVAALQQLEDNSNGIINPGNRADQFVFVEAGDSGLIGIGTAQVADGAFGGRLTVDDAVNYVLSGQENDDVEVTQAGEDFVLEIAGMMGTTDTVVLDGDLFLT
jgi:hypothetical protein